MSAATALDLAIGDAETLPVLDPKSTAVVSNTVAEESLCGAVLHLRGALDEMRGLVRPEDFHAPARAELVRIGMALADSGSAIDESTVAAELARRRLLDRFGGDEWLRSFRDRVPELDAVPTLARSVAELAQARRLIETARRIVADGLNSTDAPRDFVERSLVRIGRVAESRSDCSVEILGDVIDQAEAKWARLREEKRDAGGMPTGFDELDAITRGMRFKSVSFVGALTGRGKSVFAMQVANHVASNPFDNESIGVVYVSGEMDADSLHERALCARAEVSERMLERVMKGSPDRRDERPLDPQKAEQVWQRVRREHHAMRSLPVAVFARVAGINDIRGAVRDASRRFRKLPAGPNGKPPRVGLIVVDYVQMMKVSARAERHDIALGEFVYQLKDLADHFNAHVICCAQMNKGVKERASGVGAEDMKNASALGESAHTSLYIHRPAFEMPKGSEKREIWWPYSEIHVTKGRSHGVGEVAVIFEGAHYRFRAPRPGELEDIRERAKSASGTKKYAPGSRLPGAE